ncbi:hypothetical protein F4810DRAFT_158688 [Camillea tinctor]|nr:hypothetical protein F4810DRAFT_158688 [Camillea tinctor]
MKTYDGIWRKRHLLPPWILQILLSIILGGTAISVLAGPFTPETSSYFYAGRPGGRAIWGGGTAGLAVATIALIAGEAALYGARKLGPGWMLGGACAKTLAWGVWVVPGTRASLVSAALGVVMLGAGVVEVGVGAVYTHRERKGTLFLRGEEVEMSEKVAEVKTGYEF